MKLSLFSGTNFQVGLRLQNETLKKGRGQHSK